MDDEIKFDFELAPYAKLRDELLLDDIHCGWNARHQMTLSYQTGPIWPDSNSFWVTYATGKWLLFPWYLDSYAIRNEADFSSLCRRCMESTDSVMRNVPEEIVEEFELRILTEKESSAVSFAMRQST